MKLRVGPRQVMLLPISDIMETEDVMRHILDNGKITVAADSRGAELKSIRKCNDSEAIEYLWQLNPSVWERQAPLLFPLIGRLKDERYTHGGSEYEIGIHGFARHMEFKTRKISESAIEFTLADSPETMEQYPFAFNLTITYELEGFTILKSHSIENTGSETMYYEIGGHEGYNLSLFPGEAMEDYYIEFNGMDTISTYTADDDVMINRDKAEVALDGGRLFLSPEVFKDDALIIDRFAERSVSILNTRNGRGVTVDFEDFKYLGIWTKYMRSDYVCIEPWSSLPDCNFLGYELKEKQDIRMVEPGCGETLRYAITVR